MIGTNLAASMFEHSVSVHVPLAVCTLYTGTECYQTKQGVNCPTRPNGEQFWLIRSIVKATVQVV